MVYFVGANTAYLAATWIFFSYLFRKPDVASFLMDSGGTCKEHLDSIYAEKCLCEFIKT